jgi:WD40 repeat protein
MLRTFDQGHGLSSVLLSPDGKTIATFGTDGTARLWNGATGNPIGNPLKHDGPVQESAFSPKGQALVLAYQDGGWQVWDAQTGEPIGDENREGTLTEALGFPPDGNNLRLLGKNGTLKEVDSSWMSPTDPKELLARSRVAGLCEVNAGGSLDPVSEDDWIKDWRQAREDSRP